jgi:AcrR family transcriptional regulator
MTDGTARASRSDDTRLALLAAAHDLLATEGPASLTVRRIAAAAGVSTMNVYSRFGGKDGVLDELFIDGFRRLAARVEDSPNSDDPMDDLRQCGACYRQFARDNPTYYALMFARVVPEFEPSATAQEVALAALGKVAARVERAMAAGKLRAGDPMTVASALWALQHGLASLELSMGASEHGRSFDWDVIAPLAVDALLSGLAASP